MVQKSIYEYLSLKKRKADKSSGSLWTSEEYDIIALKSMLPDTNIGIANQMIKKKLLPGRNKDAIRREIDDWVKFGVVEKQGKFIIKFL